MKIASIFFAVLISSLVHAIGVYGDDDIIAPQPPPPEDILAEDADKKDMASSMINNESMDHPHHHDLHRGLSLQEEVVVSPPPPPRRLGSSYTTVTITVPKDDPNTVYGMPTSLKAGTIYKFKFVNKSSVYHSFRIHGGDGWYATPICAYCTKYITLQVKVYYNLFTGEWEPWAQYYFYPYGDSVEYIMITSS